MVCTRYNTANIISQISTLSVMISTILLKFPTLGTKDEWITPTTVTIALAIVQVPFWIYLIKVSTANLCKEYKDSRAQAATEHSRKGKLNRMSSGAGQKDTGSLALQVVGARLLGADQVAQSGFFSAEDGTNSTTAMKQNLFSAMVVLGPTRLTTDWKPRLHDGSITWDFPCNLSPVRRGTQLTVRIFSGSNSINREQRTTSDTTAAVSPELDVGSMNEGELVGTAEVQVGILIGGCDVDMDTWIDLVDTPPGIAQKGRLRLAWTFEPSKELCSLPTYSIDRAAEQVHIWTHDRRSHTP
eukprot:SAG31_NODE_483_length_15042_cov_28.867764_3_plen_299_part_00